MIACIAAVLPSNLYLWSWRFIDLHRHTYSYYLYRDEIAALEWLKHDTEPSDIVLASLTIGQYVPAISGNTSFLAHWAQTVDFFDKESRVNHFFDPATPDAERAQTVRDFQVAYVFYGPAERQLGAYDPSTTPWLTLEYSNSLVSVYQVQSNRLPARGP
jgi:uncharacterized membrane protein